jgi:hypothetical protein
MGTSDVMMGLVAAGGGLTLLYLVAELLSWQMIKAAEVRAGMVLRDLYKKLHASGTKLHARSRPYLDRRKKIRPPIAD